MQEEEAAAVAAMFLLAFFLGLAGQYLIQLVQVALLALVLVVLEGMVEQQFLVQ